MKTTLEGPTPRLIVAAIRRAISAQETRARQLNSAPEFSRVRDELDELREYERQLVVQYPEQAQDVRPKSPRIVDDDAFWPVDNRRDQSAS